MSAVLAELKKSPKGQLNYTSPLDSIQSPEERKEFLDVLTAPPPFSPDILSLLCKRTQRMTLGSSSPGPGDNGGHGNSDGSHDSIIYTSTAGGPGRSSGQSLQNRSNETFSYQSVHHHTSVSTRLFQTPQPSHSLPEASQSLHRSRPQSDSTVAHTDSSPAIVVNLLDGDSRDGKETLLEYTDAGSVTDTISGEQPVETGFVSAFEESDRQLCEMERSFEDDLMTECEESIQLRRQLILQQKQRVREENEENYRKKREARERRRELRRVKEQAQEMLWRQKIESNMNSLSEEYRHRAEMMEAKLRSGEEQKIAIQRRNQERKRQDLLKLVEHCREIRVQAVEMQRKMQGSLKTCLYPQLLPRSVLDKFSSVAGQLDGLQNSLTSMEQSGHPDLAQVEAAYSSLTDLQPLQAELTAVVEAANEHGEREKREREEQAKLLAQKLLEEQEKAQQRRQVGDGKGEAAKSPTTVSQKQISPPASSGTESSAASELGMPKSMLEVYDKLQENMTTTVQSYDGLVSTKDPQLKKFRFNLQKAVSTPVNAISVQSGEHLIDKIHRLHRLLSGQRVEVTGRTISVDQHPGAKMYCFNLLAKKLVKQGEEQVASQADAAFPVAAVAVGVWSELPELGDLLMFQFFSSCPSLIPFHMPKKEGMSDMDHLKLQGYHISDSGAAESEDMFLKRMGGVVRLYAAILQTPQFFSDKPHPHGLENGWAWLARVLNMDPHPTLTATALFNFLEVAGHALMRKYGRQFKKLLLLLCKEYIHKIEAVTPPDQQGPLSRLKLFLEECVSSGRIPEPKGCLTQDFWSTRSHGIAVA